MFERGIQGHSRSLLSLPVVQIPLVIFEPGQTERKDIFSPTSAVDILPTVLHLSGQNIPDWIEGEVLPPYSSETQGNPSRNIYSVHARYNSPTQPLTQASLMILKENFKLTKYIGYEELGNNDPTYELYDLKNDPEELVNLVYVRKDVFSELAQILNDHLKKADEPYQ